MWPFNVFHEAVCISSIQHKDDFKAEGSNNKYINRKSTAFSAYPHGGSCLLCSYATDEISQIRKMQYPRSLNHQIRPHRRIHSTLVAKRLRYRGLYEKYDLCDIFINGYGMSILQSLRGCSASQNSASLHNLAFHETPLRKLQGSQQRSLQGQVGVTSQHRRRERQTRGRSVNVITSYEIESTLIRYDSRPDPNVNAVVSRLPMTALSSANQSTNQSNTKASSNRFDS